ncbi:cytochrome C oxidase subunit I [Streptomyces sp. RS10V-4]|uniref:cytochrome C oxidase subunit I n=1 Tax=Streptomyces rhizoryzae TaxID=2932493 RepID=UPI0020068A0F|nr:cytochrome C oxidase subunit I [Streptomyces rhizoryzae]MCK7622827.1 cytochrome C oxidase subunit I [Streptomyces rhizoryzae]
MSGTPGHRTDSERLGNEVEGYLLWQARVREAEQRAEEFVRPLEWLTTSQRVEIEQRYVEDSLRRARRDLERIAARCRSLRAEYEARYRQLRHRCLALTLATCAGLGMLVTLLLRA